MPEGEGGDYLGLTDQKWKCTGYVADTFQFLRLYNPPTPSPLPTLLDSVVRHSRPLAQPVAYFSISLLIDTDKMSIFFHLT